MQKGKLVPANSRTRETHRLASGWKFLSKPSRGIPLPRQWEQRFHLIFRNPDWDCRNTVTWKWEGRAHPLPSSDCWLSWFFLSSPAPPGPARPPFPLYSAHSSSPLYRQHFLHLLIFDGWLVGLWSLSLRRAFPLARLYSFRVVVWDFQPLGVRASLITLDSGSILLQLFCSLMPI